MTRGQNTRGQNNRGRLIAIEGIDGAGKSTQAQLLADGLGAIHTFQFGATPVGALLRDILLDPANVNLDDKTELLLILADKAQHVSEIVEPALNGGTHVVVDRFGASTLAYQGYGRGLDLDVLAKMTLFSTGGLEPDITILLDIDLDMRSKRLGDNLDRLEQAEVACDSGPESGADTFISQVRNGYLELAAADPERWIVVDASGNSADIAATVLQHVKDRLSL